MRRAKSLGAGEEAAALAGMGLGEPVENRLEL
jgi:hypothetical protein